MKYFAYGSNMNREQMKDRCPDSVLIGPASLQGYKIAFTTFSEARNCGCADIIKSSNDVVWGLLYEVSSGDLANLDVAEGHPTDYRRIQKTVKDEQGKDCVAETYEVVTKEANFIKPSEHYLSLMREAAHTFSFPKTYQEMLETIETTP